ncbi:MAG: hypothetical protein ACLQGP_41915 [Isosphaeraceae bacterium]
MRKIRFTIGGLMAVVVVAAVDFAALRTADATWAGALALLTYGALGLAIFGILFRRGAERAWWVGFLVFGWGYLRVAPWAFAQNVRPPTLILLEWLRGRAGAPPIAPDPFALDYLLLRQVDRCLWVLPVALLGGVLARAFYASLPVTPEHTEPVASEAVRPTWRRAIPPILIGLAGLILIRSAMAVLWTSEAALWAGGTFLLTCTLLGMATLGAILGRGRRRDIWIGASIFGVGYLFMAMFAHVVPHDETISVYPRATDRFLDALRPLLPPASTGQHEGNRRILEVLERKIPMRFPDGTTLHHLFKYVKEATATPDRPDLPIAVDPLGLQEAERSLNSIVQINLDGVALKTSLALCLRQLGLAYVVKDGRLWISSEDEESGSEGGDSFRIVGHSLLALIAAAIGAVLAPLMSAVSRDRPGRGEIEAAPAPSGAQEDRAGLS